MVRILLGLALVLSLTAASAQTPGEVAFKRLRTGDPGFGPGSNGNACFTCHENPIQPNGDETVGGSGPNYRSAIWLKLLPSGVPFIAHKFQTVMLPNPVGGNFKVSNRAPPTTFGTGQVELISDGDIYALADPQDVDGDGISGRPNIVNFRAARFGSQACFVDLESTVRAALRDEFSITTAEQAANSAFYDSEVALLLDFVRSLPPPAPVVPPGDEDEVARGEEVFEEIDCAGCHALSMPVPGGEIHPLSDFLLHDMGPGLDDGIVPPGCGIAQTKEWRTAPLWQLRVGLLHDGRTSQSIITDVLRWHGGEATNAANAFFQIANTDDGRALLKFLQTR